MPYFFNSDYLTPEQQSRWDSSVKEYERVMHSNIARYGISPEWLEPVGHPKSALFARLLNGKKALPYPPPKSGGYPCYSLIEFPGPHAIKLETRSIIQSQVHQARELSRSIKIEDSLWMIHYQNEAASKLIGFLSSVTDDKRLNTLSRSSEHYKRLLNCLEDGPEWIVRFGEWPEYRLYMGRIITTATKGYACKKEMDLNQLAGGHPKILRTNIANPNLSDSTRYISFGRGKYAQYFSWLESLHNIIRKMVLFNSDWIEYECDAWVIEKI
jgi:hypothetical protein